MKKNLILCLLILAIVSCKKTENSNVTEETIKDTIARQAIEQPIKKTVKEIKEALEAKGFKTFDYIDEITKDTILMQQYFIAFLKNGTIRSQNEEEAELLQKEHLAHLSKMYELGYADISGPFGDKGNIRGITIYNVPTLKIADSLANADPMVKAGRLVIEMHPWWAAKGTTLR